MFLYHLFVPQGFMMVKIFGIFDVFDLQFKLYYCINHFFSIVVIRDHLLARSIYQKYVFCLNCLWKYFQLMGLVDHSVVLALLSQGKILALLDFYRSYSNNKSCLFLIGQCSYPLWCMFSLIACVLWLSVSVKSLINTVRSYISSDDFLYTLPIIYLVFFLWLWAISIYNIFSYTWEFVWKLSVCKRENEIELCI